MINIFLFIFCFPPSNSKVEDLLWTLQKHRTTSKSEVKRANLAIEAPMYNEIPIAKIMDLLSGRLNPMQDYK